jgi:hypothetical protein
MGRAPCCEMMGLKKGPWTPEEDQILVSYIRSYGHGNWRALPKQAGNYVLHALVISRLLTCSLHLSSMYIFLYFLINRGQNAVLEM